ncbi:MAG: ECF transporter S component [Planifilum sp.]|jgi:energy-coupling factor transport system substrate-specific component
MMQRSSWFRFSTPSLVLIPVAVGINYIGKLFAGTLKLPLWLDSIGTVLAGMLAGPAIGALSGAINNVIYGLTVDPISFVYGLTSILIGLVSGIMASRGWITGWARALVVGLAVGLTATAVSTPLNVWFWGGQTGNFWGDALFAVVLAQTGSVWLASFLDEVVVDIPDKLLTVLVAYALFRSLPKGIKQLYSGRDELETLDG